jgi:hypothetical protein
MRVNMGSPAAYALPDAEHIEFTVDAASELTVLHLPTMPNYLIRAFS